MSRKVWLITGASRGLGLEFVRQLLESSENIVLATCRSPTTAQDLSTLEQNFNPADGRQGTLHIVQMDTSEADSVAAAAAHVGGIIGDNGVIDVLVNNAGIFLDKEKNGTPLTLDTAAFLKTFNTNVLGVCYVLQHFTTYLDRSTKPIVVNISSGAGSIGSNSRMQSTGYSASKAALNMITSKFAHERPKIITISMCPGWVKTDMGGQNTLITPDKSISGMLKVIDSLTEKDTGTFRRYNGAVVPW